MLPWQEVRQQGPIEVFPRTRRAKRCTPLIGAGLPGKRSQVGNGVQSRQLILAAAHDYSIPNFGGRISIGLAVSRGDSNGDGSLNRKNVLAFARATPFPAEIQNPDFIA